MEEVEEEVGALAVVELESRFLGLFLSHVAAVLVVVVVVVLVAVVVVAVGR